MEPKAPAQIVWIYASEDEPLARELLKLARVLEAQGIQNTILVDIERSQLGEPRLEIVRRAHVAMLLCSQSLLEGPEAPALKRTLALVKAMEARASATWPP